MAMFGEENAMGATYNNEDVDWDVRRKLEQNFTEDDLKRLAELRYLNELTASERDASEIEPISREDILLLEAYNTFTTEENSRRRDDYLAQQEAFDGGEKTYREPDRTKTIETPVALDGIEGDFRYVTGEPANLEEETRGVTVITDDGYMATDNMSYAALISAKQSGYLPLGRAHTNNRMTWGDVTRNQIDPSNLPRGTRLGIPEGESADDYVMVGVAPRPGFSGSQMEGVYAKILRRPVETTQETIPGRDISFMGTPPAEPDLLQPIGLTRVSYEGEVETVQPGIDEPATPSPDEPDKEPFDWGDFAQGAAYIGAGLSDVTLNPISIQVPSFNQERYSSPVLGPSVENLFRGR